MAEWVAGKPGDGQNGGGLGGAPLVPLFGPPVGPRTEPRQLGLEMASEPRRARIPADHRSGRMKDSRDGRHGLRRRSLGTRIYQSPEARSSALPIRAETLRVLRHPSVAGIDIKQLRYRSSDIGFTVFETLRVVMCHSPVRFRSGGSTSPIPSGGVLIIEPGAVHAAAASRHYINADILIIDAPAIAQLTGEQSSVLYSGLSFKNRISTSEGLTSAFRALSTALVHLTDPGLLVEERACVFIETLESWCAGRIAMPSDSSVDGQSVRRARDMIHDLFRENVTLDALAGASGLPKYRFLRAFKRLVGLPPHAYQTQLRVDHARQMMARGASISDASASAGFCDQSHFHRHFARHQGLTPGEYRGLHR